MLYNNQTYVNIKSGFEMYVYIIMTLTKRINVNKHTKAKHLKFVCIVKRLFLLIFHLAYDL